MANPIVPHRTITLTQGKVTLVDAEDFEWLSRWSWYAHKRKRKTGEYAWYAVRKEPDGRMIYMHREIMAAPRGMDVDHKFGDGLDNRRSELRLATRRQNLQNRRHAQGGKTSRFRGVSWWARDGNWRAQGAMGAIKPNGHARHVSLGYFATEEAAARAYDAAARLHFGEFASLNFPEG